MARFMPTLTPGRFPYKPDGVFDGNSLTQGQGASGPSKFYPAQTIALLAGSWDSTNYGASGQTTGQRRTAAQVQTQFNRNRAKNIAVLWEVTNDLFVNQNASAAITAYAGWCGDVRAAGFKVVAVTVLPRSNVGTYAGFETDRQTVNTSIRANYTTYADALADVAADHRIGDAGDETDTTYYAGDNVHLNDTGYGVVASIVAPRISAL